RGSGRSRPASTTPWHRTTRLRPAPTTAAPRSSSVHTEHVGARSPRGRPSRCPQQPGPQRGDVVTDSPISDEMLDGYWKNGFVVVPGLLPEQDLPPGEVTDRAGG